MAYPDLTRILHEVANAPGFRLVVTAHAAERMQERDVTRFEVERVLRAGAVTMVETDTRGRETWRVAGVDMDGRRIEPVVEVRLPDRMILITLIRVATRRGT